MTPVQIVALICLPFAWMLLAGAPSRGAMRRMRRNARKGGVPEDVAFDRWVKKHGRSRDAVDRLREAPSHDQAAFALVASAAEEIEQAAMKGETTDQAKHRVRRERWPAWVEQCGPDIAGRASEMLDRCGPAAFLVPGELARTVLEAAPRPRA